MVSYLLVTCGVIYVKEPATLQEQVLIVHVMCKFPTSCNECWVGLYNTVSLTIVRTCFILLHARGLQ